MTEKERQRVKKYYNKEQYKNISPETNIPKLFEGVVEVFNPVQNISRALADASTRGLGTTDVQILKIWQYNSMELFSRKIIKELYLYSEIFVEVIKREDGTIRYEALDLDNIAYDEYKGELREITIQTEEGERTYKKEKGKVVKIENGKSLPFILDVIPVIHFSIDSNIVEGLNLIDSINETEAFIRKILSIQGMPVLHAANVANFADRNSKDAQARKNSEMLKQASYNAQAVVNTTDLTDKAASFKYIELTNPLISDMQAHIKRLEERFYKIFPEASLVDLSSSNVNASETTYAMKNQGLRNKIAAFRLVLLDNLARLDGIALAFLRKQKTFEEIKAGYFYTDIFERQDKTGALDELDRLADILTKLNTLDADLDLKAITTKLTNMTEDEIKKLL